MAKKELTLDYSSSMFVEMLQFLRNRMSNNAPNTSHYGGYTYVFKNEDDKKLFDDTIETNESAAMALVFDSWKEGSSAYLDIKLTSGYSNKVMLGTTGNTIEFSWSTNEGGSITYEPVTVNYTFERGGATKTLQETYAAYDADGNINKVKLNIDNYLGEGVNNITILVRGNISKVASTASVTYTVSQLTLNSDFNIAKIRAVNESLLFNITAKGTPDDGQSMVVLYCVDGTLLSLLEYTVLSTNIGKLIPQSLTVTTTPGKHFLLMRIKTLIGGQTKYSDVLYYEFIVNGADGRLVAISRQLNSKDFLGSMSSLTLLCKQYVQETINWAFYSSNSGDKVNITWSLTSLSGETTSVGNTTLGEDTAVNDGTIKQFMFLPIDFGQFALKAIIEDMSPIVDEKTSIGNYSVYIDKNSSIQESTIGLVCRLNATGRDNSEESSIRSQWSYHDITSTFTNFDWTQRNGWYNNALNVLGGTVQINLAPFENMDSASAGTTVEVDFETFSASDEDVSLFTVTGNNAGTPINIIDIKATSASFKSNGGTTIVDKFPTNTRMKLAFIAHAAEGLTDQPLLMEIINGGISSRLVNYAKTDSFYSNGKIKIGGTDLAGIKIYSIRVYHSELSTKEELDNVIISSDDITSMVLNNDIYSSGTTIDVEKIRNRIPCLAITGKGGQNILKTIWDYTDETGRPTIYVDAEWTNPQDPNTDFTIENMRLRGHGQSTMRNPMKSLKAWLKDDESNTQYTTKFYPKGVEDESEDHRWSMTTGAHPANKFVFQCYYIDSSNIKSPTILLLYNDVAIAAGILTPPQLYARDTYPTTMGEDFPSNFEIRQAPGSLPCCIISRDDSTSSWKYEGIFVLMNDKKSDYLYGERSIYGAPRDPFCYTHKKSSYGVLWDNSKVTRFEFKSNNHPIAAMNNAAYITNNFYAPPQAFTEEDEEQSDPSTADPDKIESGGEGGDTSGETSSTSFDFELAIEIIYPDYDDFYDKNNVFNLTKYKTHTNKYYNFALWVATCYQQGVNSSKFRLEASKHMDLEKWAYYYIFFRTFGGFDSVVRNLLLTTMEEVDGNPIWFPLPWDWDIAFGTINTGPLAFDPPVNRQTENSFGVAFRGKDSALWNMLEAWQDFKNLVSTTLDKMYNNGFTYNNIIRMLKKNADTWPEAMYNESENTKYKLMYLSDPLNKSSFLAYNLGRGLEFMYWWLKVNFDTLCSEFAAGSFSAQGVNWRGNNDYSSSKTYHYTVSYDRETFFGWSLGNDKQTTSNGTYSMLVEANKKYTIALPKAPSNSEYTTIYSAPYIKTLDISEFGDRLGNLNLGALVDDTTGTMIEEFYFGVGDTQLAQGVRNAASAISIVGLDNLTSIRKLQCQGFTGLPTFNISSLSALTHLYAKGSAFTSMTLPSSASIEVAQLPDTLQSFSLDRTTINSLTFYDASNISITHNFPHSMVKCSFTGLGESALVKNLVLDWLEYVDNNGTIGTCSLTIYSVSWKNLTYDQIKRIGKVGNLTITGYIEYAGLFTSELMSELLGLYDMTKYDIFNKKAAFYIGCRDLGFIMGVSGDIEVCNDGVADYLMLTGKTCKFAAAAFPLSGASSMFWNFTDGNDSSNESNYKTIFVGKGTGNVRTEESNLPDYYVTLNVTNGVVSTSVKIKVIARKYPSSVSILNVDANGNVLDLLNGKVLFANNGAGGYLYFKTNFIVDGVSNLNFNGTLSSHLWTYSDTSGDSFLCDNPNHHSSLGGSDRVFCLHIISTPDLDVEQVLKYRASFLNSRTIDSPELKIVMFSICRVIGQVGNSFGGNMELYNCLLAKGILKDSDNYITNEYSKNYTADVLTIPANSGVSRFGTTIFNDNGTTKNINNVLSFFTNVNGLDATGCTTLVGSYNLNDTKWFNKLKLGGTSMTNIDGLLNNSTIKTVHMNAPTYIRISNCSKINIS